MKMAVNQFGQEQALTWDRVTGMVRWSLFFSVCGLAGWSLISWVASLPYTGWSQWVVVVIAVGIGVTCGSHHDTA
jgi:hypothetical protein